MRRRTACRTTTGWHRRKSADQAPPSPITDRQGDAAAQSGADCRRRQQAGPLLAVATPRASLLRRLPPRPRLRRERHKQGRTQPAAAAWGSSSVRASRRRRSRQWRAGLRIEIKRGSLAAVFEIEQAVDRSGGRIEGAAAEPRTLQPIVFDEAHHGGESNLRVADIVLLRPRRNHKERYSRAGTASAVDRLAADARQRGAGAALPGPSS